MTYTKGALIAPARAAWSVHLELLPGCPRSLSALRTPVAPVSLSLVFVRRLSSIELAWALIGPECKESMIMMRLSTLFEHGLSGRKALS